MEQRTNQELMVLDGRYRTMFDLQAARFAEGDDGDDGDVDTEVNEVLG